MSQQPQRKKGRPDALLLILVIFLAVFGLVFLYSSSSYNGRVRFHDSFYYFKKQLFATALGLAAMYVVSETDYHFWVSLAPVVYLMSVVLSTAVLLVGQEINGSKRWLSLGPLSFQPSEFAKVAVILFLARQIDRSRNIRHMVYVPYYGNTSSYCGTGGFQQSQYGYHYSGNRSDPYFCVKSGICAVRRYGKCGSCIYYSVSCCRKLSSGTSGYLEKSGKI